MPGEARPGDVTVDFRKSVDPHVRADFNNLTAKDIAELQQHGAPFEDVLFENTGVAPNPPAGMRAAGLTEQAFHNAFDLLKPGGILSVQTVDSMEATVRQFMKAAGFGPVTKTPMGGGIRLSAVR
jgi:hypothetical protein